MCFREWNPDNGDGAQNTHKKMEQGDFPPSGNYPYNIEYCLDTASVCHNFHISSEWAKCQPGQFEHLNSEWDADNCYAQ